MLIIILVRALFGGEEILILDYKIMQEWPYKDEDEDDDGDGWKTPAPEDNPRNELDYQKKIIVNNYTRTPYTVDNWTIIESENQRVDTYFCGTYFSLVLGEKPYIEIFRTNPYGDLVLPPEKIIELGEYFNK